MSLTMRISNVNSIQIRTFIENRKWISKQADVISSDGETFYRVRIFKAGNFSCSCKSYLYRGSSLVCSHVKKLARLIKVDLTVTPKEVLISRTKAYKSVYQSVDPFILAQSSTSFDL